MTRLVGGGFAALLIAPWLGGVGANAATALPISLDSRANPVAGNATTCADVGFAGDTQFGSDNSSGNSANGFVVTSDGQNLTVSAIPDNTEIDVLIVKGGDAYNVYDGSLFTPSTKLPVAGLQAPLVGNPPKNVPTISHWFLCYGTTDEQPPEVTAPSATITGDCDSADITLDAGTDATDFTVARAGDVGAQTVHVDSGQSEPYPVALDQDHPSVTVSANGTTLKTFSRDHAICDNEGGGGDNGGGGGDNQGGGDNGGGGDDQGGGNSGGGSGGGATVTHPAVSASKTCRSGITVSLSNLAATAPVTFTLTAPDGATSSVTVGADQTKTRSFAVSEDSTGTVTVTAPGLATRTISYQKNCVTVLGVKHSRHPVRHHRQRSQGERTRVLGSGAQLPFTGFNARRTAEDAGLTIGLGLALCLVAARRRESVPARRRR